MQTLLVEFMARGRLLWLPPVWCSPSHLSLHRSAGAARLGLPELPDGNRAGRARKIRGISSDPMKGPDEKQEWVGAGGPMSYGERVGAGEPRRGQSHEGSSTPLN